MNPYFVAIAGASGSGKTTLSSLLKKHYGDDAVVLSADDYYRGKAIMDEMGILSYDDPSALDWQLFAEHIIELKEGRAVEVPCYDFKTHARSEQTKKVEPKALIIIEGILVIHNEALRELYNDSIFVVTEIDVCRERRFDRDITRGRTILDSIYQWPDVETHYNIYVKPCIKHAGILVENTEFSGDNDQDITALVDSLNKRRIRDNANTAQLRLSLLREKEQRPYQREGDLLQQKRAELTKIYETIYKTLEALKALDSKDQLTPTDLQNQCSLSDELALSTLQRAILKQVIAKLESKKVFIEDAANAGSDELALSTLQRAILKQVIAKLESKKVFIEDAANAGEFSAAAALARIGSFSVGKQTREVGVQTDSIEFATAPIKPL